MMILNVKGKEYKVKFGYNSFCDTDLMDRTNDLLSLFHDNKAKNDKDVSVMGFDGLTLGSYMVPQLSTVIQSAQSMAQRSVEILIDRIENGGGACHESVTYSLHQCESTRRIDD